MQKKKFLLLKKFKNTEVPSSGEWFVVCGSLWFSVEQFKTDFGLRIKTMKTINYPSL